MEKPLEKVATWKVVFNPPVPLGGAGSFSFSGKSNRQPQPPGRPPPLQTHSSRILQSYAHPANAPERHKNITRTARTPITIWVATLTALAAGSYPVPYGIDFDRRPEAQAEVRDLRWRTGGDGDHVGLALHPLPGPRDQVRRPPTGRRGAGPAASEKAASRRRLARCLLRLLRGPGGPDFHGKGGHLRVLPAALHPVCPTGAAPERA